MPRLRLDDNRKPLLKDLVTEFMKSELHSLRELTSSKVAILICESEDMQRKIRKYYKSNGDASIGFSDRQWDRLCDKARKKIKQIRIPIPTVDIILKNLWPICFDILKWIAYHWRCSDIGLSPSFSWSPRASIDYEKTAKMLIENGILDIKKRFKLACIYCLEQEVRSMWDKMKLCEKRHFCIRGNLDNSFMNPIILYWTYYIQEVPLDHWGRKKVFNTTRLFKYALAHGYLNATKYFHGELPKRLKNMMVENSFSMHLHIYRPEDIIREHLAIVQFLVGKLRPNHAIEYIGKLRLVFTYFLEWPLQPLFMSVVDQLRFCICRIKFGELLEAILEKDIRNFKDYDYKPLFVEFWVQGSDDHKAYINTETGIGLRMFFKFIKRYFGFIFDESNVGLKAKFRSAILHQEHSEYITEFGKENLEFFRFMVRERVTTRLSVDLFAHRIFTEFYNSGRRHGFYILENYSESLAELHYLMYNILITA